MLQRMRDGLQGWVAWLIIAALIASLGFLGVNFYLKGDGDDNKAIAAKVNDTVITQQEVNAAYDRIKQQNPSAINASFEEQQRQLIVQGLIDKNLLLLAAKQNGFRVSDAQLSSMVVQIPQFQDQGQFSQERYLAVLNQFGYTSQSFLATMRQDLLLNQMQAGLSFTHFVLKNDVLNMMHLIKQTRDVDYVILSFDQQSAPRMDLSKAVPEYYQAHLSQFQSPEKIQLNYLLLSDKDSARTVTSTLPELKQFYQENISQYTKAPQWTLAHILLSNENNTPAQIKTKIEKIQAEIKAGKDFASLVKEFSDDLLTANKAGVLPLASSEALPSEFQSVIKTLKQGQVSAPIQTQQGMEILKLITYKPPVVLSFDQVEGQVRTLYVTQKAQKAFADKVQQLQDLVFQNPDSLTAAAEALHLTLQTSDWLIRNVPAKGLWNQASLLQAAFSDAVKMGNNSEILYPDAHTALVMHVKAYNAAQPIPLKTVEAQIQTLLIEEARQKLTQSLADSIAKAINEGASLEKITQQYGVKWNSIKNSGRYDSKQQSSSLILSKAFNLPHSQNVKSLTAGTTLLEKGIAVVVVSAVHHSNGALTAVDEKLYSPQLESYYNQLALSELLNFYREKAKIETFKVQVSAN
jgi:peptidyl-prolyl cis-trans isomerase D